MALIKTTIGSLVIGELLRVETEKQILIGRLESIDEKGFLVLQDPKDVANNVKYTSRQLIAWESITKIEKFNEKDIESSNDSSTSASLKSCQECASYSDCLPKLSNVANTSLTLFESELFYKQIQSVKLITHGGYDYNKAIDDIRTQHVIGLLAEPSKYGRHHKTSIITIATVTMIYIFDIQCLAKNIVDLKHILMAEYPQKAVYSSNRLFDHFQYHHKIILNGIFDISVAHCNLIKSNEFCDLESMVKSYFNKHNVFNDYNKENYPNSVYKRPLNPGLIKEYAKRAFFILKLQERLVRLMHKKFFAQCKLFSTSVADKDDLLDVADSFLKHSPKLENLSFSD